MRMSLTDTSLLEIKGRIGKLDYLCSRACDNRILMIVTLYPALQSAKCLLFTCYSWALSFLAIFSCLSCALQGRNVTFSSLVCRNSMSKSPQTCMCRGLIFRSKIRYLLMSIMMSVFQIFSVWCL